MVAAPLQCTPDWDIGLDSQNTAEVWLLLQLLTHPNRTHSWKDASVCNSAAPPKTSMHAGGGSCLGFGSDHKERLTKAIDSMRSHPAYSRRHGHDHIVLFNYWDAWGIFGDRNTPTHNAFRNISFGWHETQDAAGAWPIIVTSVNARSHCLTLRAALQLTKC